jgi:cytochrome c oxidase subunit 2
MPRRHSRFVRIFGTIVFIVVTVLFAVLIVNAFMNGGKPLTTLVPRGPSSQSIQDLVVPVFAIAGIVFVLVMAAVVFISWKFRERDSDDPEEFPEQVHGRTVLEVGWTILPALILAGVAVGTVITILELERKEPDSIEVMVVGNQWWWEFKYDVDGDGNFDGDGDITTASEMVVPAGQPVQLTTASNDVIHSFWIPGLNGKRDAVPGITSPLKLQADEPGIYRGQCTEFCGLSHANMRMLVRAVEPDVYEDWVENQLSNDHAAQPEGEEAQAGREIWQNLCAQCHVIEGINGPNSADPQSTDIPLVAGVAPDLTHLMTRGTFAGSIYNLYGDVQSTYLTGDGNGELLGDHPDDVAAAGDPGEALTGGPVAVETVNRVTLEAWLRDAPSMKPMYAQGGRGMPNLGLTEDQIDQLVAFLVTLN